MKKKPVLLASLIFLAILCAIAAAMFLLRPNMEDHVRSCIDAMNAPDSPFSIAYDQNALSISPVTRTIHLKSVIITSRQADTPVTIAMDNLAVQVVTGMLLFDQSSLPSSGEISLANRISMDNLSVTMPDATISVEAHEMDNIFCSASLLRNIVNRQPIPDLLALLGQFGAERSTSRNILYCKDQSSQRLAISSLLLDNWKGPSLDQCDVTGIDLANQTGVSAQLAWLSMKRVQLPNGEALSKIWQTLSETDDLEASLPAVSNLLTQETSPLVQRLLFDNLALHTPEGDITLNRFNVIWPSIRPQDFTCELKTLALPRNAIMHRLVQEGLVAQVDNSLSPLLSGLDSINIDARVMVKAQDTKNSSLREQIVLDIPEWAIVDYSHLGDYANPALGGRFRDMRFDYTDRGVLARVATLFFPGNDTEKQIVALLDSFSSPGTAPMIGTLKKFLAKPGSLQITSRPGKIISEGESFLIMANPTAYFDMTASQGAKSFTEQCLELRQLH